MNIDRQIEYLEKIETLTSWLRIHIRPPPAHLLYAAAHAVECLREDLDYPKEAEPA